MNNLRSYKEIEDLKPMEEYPLMWQYLTRHVHLLINNLELYRKIKEGVATQKETFEWMKMFCSDEFNVRKLTKSEIDLKYFEYEKYVSGELKRCKDLMSMEIESSRMAIDELTSSLTRVNRTLECTKN